MAIAFVRRPAAGPVAHRIERRSRKRNLRQHVRRLARAAGWAAGLLLLCWLVAAGFYGLLVSA
ncbi:MAG TPA: hypothetical protein VLS53_04890 [Candidatus Dormibacteraeota bacterium]|nr:hypothetical protein [Candidatus Dormibacteraeota bacterium]